MKKVLKTIAMLLILVILANSFTGCLTGMAIRNADFPENLILVPLAFVGDLIIIALIGLLIVFKVPLVSAELSDETGIYLANAQYTPLTDYNLLIERINSLPEMEGVFLTGRINSLPETKLASLVRTINSLPETEIAASIERLNALSETELAFVMRAFNSLSETEFDSLADSLNERIHSLPETEYVAAAGYSREKAYREFCFQ